MPETSALKKKKSCKTTSVLIRPLRDSKIASVVCVHIKLINNNLCKTDHIELNHDTLFNPYLSHWN